MPSPDREKARRARRAWKLRNPDKVRAQKREYHHRSGKHAVRTRKYGLTREEFDALMKQQKSRCAICRRPFEETGKTLVPCVDHDHDRGHVRGLLCQRCNWAIGVLSTTTDLRRAYQYLDKYLSRFDFGRPIETAAG